MLIVDLRHWLLPDGALVPEARLAPHVARIVECATSCAGDGITAMVCRYRDTRRRCAGRVCVVTKGEQIEWFCRACDDAGWISGWKDTRWDLSNVGAPEGEEHGLYLPLDELRALRDLELPATVRAALAGAFVVDARYACVALTEMELSSVLAAIVAADVGGAARRRLDRVQGRAEQALVPRQLARRARAH